jgi:hypothetical protein
MFGSQKISPHISTICCVDIFCSRLVSFRTRTYSELPKRLQRSEMASRSANGMTCSGPLIRFPAATTSRPNSARRSLRPRLRLSYSTWLTKQSARITDFRITSRQAGEAYGYCLAGHASPTGTLDKARGDAMSYDPREGGNPCCVGYCNCQMDFRFRGNDS